MRKSPELITNIAVILIGIAVIYVVGGTYVRKPGLPAALKRGVQMSLTTAGVNLSAPHTLLMFLRKGCHFCEASAPFYQRLTKTVDSSGKQIQLLALFPDDDADAATVLSNASLPLSHHASVDFGRLGVTGTPTLILVDKTGKGEKTWIGQVPASQDGGVARAMGVQAANIERPAIESLRVLSASLRD